MHRLAISAGMLDSILDIGNPNYRGQMKMAAYLIADIEVTNPEGFKKYQEVVPATIAKHGVNTWCAVALSNLKKAIGHRRGWLCSNFRI